MERKRAQTGWLWWCLEQSAFFIATIKLIIIQQRHRWTHSITTDCSSSARSTFDENSWWFICIRDPVVQQFIHDISGLALLPSTLCSGQSDCALYVQRKSVSKQHFWCCSKYSFFFLVGQWNEKGEWQREKLCLCTSSTHAFLMWIILKTASDRLIWFGKWRMETAFLFLAVSHFPPPSCLCTCP